MDDEWIDHGAPGNGIGPVCRHCRQLIDWHPVDHAEDCPEHGAYSAALLDESLAVQGAALRGFHRGAESERKKIVAWLQYWWPQSAADVIAGIEAEHHHWDLD